MVNQNKKIPELSNNFAEIDIVSVGRRPMSQQVYEKLKEAIVKGELLPGTKLTETEVAKRFNVSATPVREAFRRLSSEGFISIEPWKGVRVKALAEQEIIETYQCREALEGYACRLAAKNMDLKGIKKMRSILSAGSNDNNVNIVVETDLAFHNVILDYAHNEKLNGILGLFRNMIMHHRHYTAYIDERLKQICKEHNDILNALEQHDEDLSEKTMRLHIKNAFYYVSRQTKKEDL